MLARFLWFIAATATAFAAEVPLADGWVLQSSCEVKAAGAEVSVPGFATQGWHHTEVPSTVVAALVADKTYPDPFFGMNLRSYPGMQYRIGGLFSNMDMPENSPFKCSWWYRTEFPTPASYNGKTAWLHFDGINYRANIWLNGQKLADQADTVGPFRAYQFDITKLLHSGRPNALAVEVIAPEKEALAISFVDWNPAPPDKDMGIWKDVYLTDTGSVTLRHPFVNAKLDTAYKAADLLVSAELHNASSTPVEGVLKAEFAGVHVSQPVQLNAGETKTIHLAPQKLQNPKLWWPYQMGEPNLYAAHLAVETGGRVSDATTVHFGVREVKSEMTDKGVLLFRVNGKRVLLRGAAWTPDMLLRWSPRKAESELRLTKDMGLNTIRLEGKMERDEFFDMADRMGFLIMPGWCCCDFWERWRRWKPEHYKIAAASLEHEMRRLRNHPSVFVWLYGSDGPPPADVEQMYLDIIKAAEWPNPTISSAAADSTKLTGPSGVKMPGPYDYEPPNYWLVDKEAGGAYGLNTETSPGPAIPPLESLKRFIPADHLWPIDSVWNFHAGGERFTKMTAYIEALEKRYGKPVTLEDFLRKSQAIAYEGQRAMFEAYSRNKYTSTGVIQWMLDNAWPSLIWHLYDYYLVPAGGYYGTKKSCELVHVQYSYDDNSVAVVNSKYEPISGLNVSAKIYSVDAAEKYSHSEKVDVPADASVKAFNLPAPDALTYFLRLELRDSAGKLVSDNFYWLSSKPDVLDWKGRRDTAYTPQSGFDDLTALNYLPEVKLDVQKTIHHQADKGSMHVTIKNPSQSLAFMVHLRLTKGKDGDDVVPIFWDDNYFSLLPGESRALTGAYDLDTLDGKEPTLAVDGWNIAASAN